MRSPVARSCNGVFLCPISYAYKFRRYLAAEEMPASPGFFDLPMKNINVGGRHGPDRRNLFPIFLRSHVFRWSVPETVIASCCNT